MASSDLFLYDVSTWNKNMGALSKFSRRDIRVCQVPFEIGLMIYTLKSVKDFSVSAV